MLIIEDESSSLAVNARIVDRNGDISDWLYRNFTKTLSNHLKDYVISEAYSKSLLQVLTLRHWLVVPHLIRRSISFSSSRKMAESSKKRRVIDFSAYKFRHIAIKFAYFGWDYGGLAIQKDTTNTVSEQVLLGLEKTQLIESRDLCGMVCCGRTDKGVSAASQVVSLNARSLLNGSGVGFIEGSGQNIASRKGQCFFLNRQIKTFFNNDTPLPSLSLFQKRANICFLI